MASLPNIVRGGLNVFWNKLTGSRIPFEINIHIIDSCNLECSYCYSNFYKRGNPWISETQIFKIVDGFRKLGAIECSLIGGEPLLHPKFSQLVDYITDKGMTCSTITNGYMVPKLIESLKKLDTVCVSLDGPQEINDITRGEGSFLKGAEALQCLQENNVNRQIRVTLQKNNLGCVEEMFQLAVKYGACLNFGLLFHQASDDGTEMGLSEDLPENEDYRKVLRQIVDLKKRHPKVLINSLRNLNNALNWPTTFSQYELKADEIKKYPDFEAIPCHGGKTFATVDTNGKLYACTNQIGYDPEAPDILEMEVDAAWNSLKSHKCEGSCFYVSSVEKNLISELNLDAITNFFKVKRVN